MGIYVGGADLLDKDGHVVAPLRVVIESREPTASSLGWWQGSIDPVAVGPADWTDATRIRLTGGESGGEGDIIVNNVEIKSGGPLGPTQTGTFLGSGLSPIEATT